MNLSIHRLLCVLMTVTLFSCFHTGFVNGDMVTLVPAPGLPTGANVNAIAGDLFPPGDLDTADVVAPSMGVVSASSEGNTATHTYALEPDYSTGPGFFDHVFSDFSRIDVADHRASAEGLIHFTVDAPVIYAIDGFFSVDDDNDLGPVTPGSVELEIVFADITSPMPVGLYSSYQVSTATEDQLFVAGGMDGDTVSDFSGSPTGILTPGSLYSFRFLVTAVSTAGTDASATAEGAIMMSFTPVPEPGTMTLLGVAASCICLIRRRP